MPAGYFFMSRWLSNFAYRVGFSWQAFVFAGAVSFIIAISTMSYQAIKTSLVNPAKTLRNQ
jgi:putative ABC transport system permease protein